MHIRARNRPAAAERSASPTLNRVRSCTRARRVIWGQAHATIDALVHQQHAIECACACAQHLEQPSDPDRRLRIAGPAANTASSSSRGKLTARASNQGMQKTAGSKTSANEGTPHLGQPWIQHRGHRIASSPARNPSRHDHATSSETAIGRHKEQTFFFSSIRIKHCISACAKYLQQPRNYDPRRSILREKPESTSQLVASQQSTIHYTSKRSSNNT